MKRIFVAFALGLLLLTADALAAPQAEKAEAKAEKAKKEKSVKKGAKAKKEEKKKDPMTASTFAGLELRGIGPAVVGGRIGDIAVDPTSPSTWYVAVASGGVWKTTNAGTTWTPIFDGQGSFSIGCVAIDPKNPLVVWVGTGENNSQRSVSYGDGVYKSDRRRQDAGRTWGSRSPSTSARS